MSYNFSVLLSVYYKENPIYLEQAINSIYFSQTLKPNEIVLVEDGPLNKQLYDVIKKLKMKIGANIFKVVSLEKNMGLGNALQRGLLECKNEYIMRMDTDDIAYPERFEKQIQYIKENPDIDVLGTYMSEFSRNIDNIICLKTAAPNNIDMKKYIRFRDPVNHPSVLLKKNKVLECGNYQEIFLNEDSYLWARMLAKGAKFANLAEPLVYFRVDDNTYKRRGGLRYIKAEWCLQKKYKELGLISWIEFWENVILKTIVRIMPNFMRKLIYLKLLRR